MKRHLTVFALTLMLAATAEAKPILLAANDKAAEPADKAAEKPAEKAAEKPAPKPKPPKPKAR